MDENEQMELFHEMFNPSLGRLGPGDSRSTNRALDMVLGALAGEKALENPPEGLSVLDIGCGNGPETIELARRIGGKILAVDNHKPFLDELILRAEASGLSEKISVLLADMSDMGLEPESFDIIWSEGAISLMGFRKGFELCRHLLVPGGLTAVTELCWFEPDPPAECACFFDNAYPAMAGIEANISIIDECGFQIIDHFKLPESSWLEEFYTPLEKVVDSVRTKYSGYPEKLELIELIQKEIDIYRKYSDYYGYAFFVACKR